MQTLIPSTGLTATAIQPSFALDEAELPSLDTFTNIVFNGKADQVVGVYADNALALPARQQPQDTPNFVSTRPDEVTQFATASRFNTIGLLAHNFLAGENFYSLVQDQIVYVIYGDGRQVAYQITDIQQYQALTPTSPLSNFVDLNGSGETLTAVDLFNRVYRPGERLVLQTCINAFGDASWGRLFIIATPVEEQALSLNQHPLSWL